MHSFLASCRRYGMTAYLMAPVTKLRHASPEAHDDSFCTQLYTSRPKMSVCQSAFGMTPVLRDSWALVYCLVFIFYVICYLDVYAKNPLTMSSVNPKYRTLQKLCNCRQCPLEKKVYSHYLPMPTNVGWCCDRAEPATVNWQWTLILQFVECQQCK